MPHSFHRQLVNVASSPLSLLYSVASPIIGSNKSRKTSEVSDPIQAKQFNSVKSLGYLEGTKLWTNKKSLTI